MTDKRSRPNDDMPDAKTNVLFEAVRRHRDEQCKAIDDATEAQAKAIVARAYRDARAKVHRAIAQERRIRERALEKQRARIETAKRQDRQNNENAFLEAVWQQLLTALQDRWQDPAARRAWLNGTVAQALAHLHPGAWRIEHPAAWQTAELDPLLERILKFSGATPSFVATPALAVGVRISANGATIDGTLAGVIADRGEVSAVLLAHLFQDAEDLS